MGTKATGQTTRQPELLSLADCHRRLLDDPSVVQAPSYVVLKRWSAAGLLDSARLRQPGERRERYAYGKVRALVHKRKGEAVPEAPVPDRTGTKPATPLSPVGDSVPPVPPDATDASTEGAGPALALLTNLVQGLIETADAIASELADLRHMRHTLMTKYDAEAALLRERDSLQRAELSRLRQDTSTVDVAKLQMTLQQLLQRLPAPQPR